MRGPGRVDAVGVVIPARDEGARIGACLQALRSAIVTAGVRTEVCVVADQCRDDTVAVARRTMPDVLIRVPAGPVPLGRVRDLGVRYVLDALSHVDPERIWLLSTDADSVVGPQWIAQHRRFAARGLDGVAAGVELTDGRFDDAVLDRYHQHVRDGLRTPGYHHVYGANLGVRAGAYLAIGGYRPLDTGEDRDLWARVRAGGHPVVSTREPLVRTSSRTDGRARGGLADLLRQFATR
jgi:glycosyltransferase involved in cell wall biosynthesis